MKTGRQGGSTCRSCKATSSSGCAASSTAAERSTIATSWRARPAQSTISSSPWAAVTRISSRRETATTIVLQFGGCSGSGYLSRPEVKQGTDELKQFGTFDGGVYRRNPGLPGKRNVDGYQAIWEHVNRRPLQYPKPRYPGPVMMDAAHFNWVPSREHPGVEEKLLGVFTERRAATGF